MKHPRQKARLQRIPETPGGGNETPAGGPETGEGDEDGSDDDGDPGIVYAPRGSKKNGTSYERKVGGPETTWCNVFANNVEIVRGGSPDTRSLIDRYPCGSFDYYTGEHNASRTKVPFENTKGYVYYWFKQPRLQPQHVEYYERRGDNLTIWRTSGRWNDPPQEVYPGLDDILGEFQRNFDKTIYDFWFVPSEPLQ